MKRTRIGTEPRREANRLYRWLVAIIAAGCVCTACAQVAEASHPITHLAPIQNPRALHTSHSIVSRRRTMIGTASWYGPGLEGHRTCSGERFHERSLTAASTSLPLGSRVKVTNLDNGRSVRLRVNDCGPFVRGRKIDVSRHAAERLAIRRRGVASVRIQVIYVPRGTHADRPRTTSHRKKHRSRRATSDRASI